MTIRDAESRTVAGSFRNEIRMVNLRWRLGPYPLSTSSTPAALLTETPGALLSQMRSLIAVCLFPVVLIVTFFICRAVQWHARPTEEFSRLYRPLRTVAALMSLQCLLIVAFMLFRPLWPSAVMELIQWFRANAMGVSSLLWIAVVVPVAEEFIFRAGLCRVLVKQLGVTGGIVLQALLFGLVHIATPLHVVVGLIGGIVLGMVYIFTRSLTATILLHSGANLALALACLIM
ncbi:MAG: CPBP family intramembrane glutamic endopeptidase [Planctomycetota bacterium]